MKTAETAVDTELLAEAADWILLLRSNQMGAREQREFEQWRERSPSHREAWRRAESVLQTFGNVPVGIGHNALGSLQRASRRRVLGMLLAAAPAGWIAWRGLQWTQWTADVATATGQRQTLDLADNTHLVLNTASAVDIAFSKNERRLRLRTGEILITTGNDPVSGQRPFVVETDHGAIRPLGTRFSVRLRDGATRVTVFEHAVEIRPMRAGTLLLRAGEQSTFDAAAVQPAVPAEAGASAWEHGMLVAKGMPLADVLTELGRYRRGLLRCDPAVAALPVSGAMSLDDTDAALRLLAGTLPIRIERGRFWTTVTSR